MYPVLYEKQEYKQFISVRVLVSAQLERCQRAVGIENRAACGNQESLLVSNY